MILIKTKLKDFAMTLSFTLKSIFKAKEELWKLKYFTMQKYNLQKKNPLKEKPKSFKILL
jgi:hypothetical protein